MSLDEVHPNEVATETRRGKHASIFKALETWLQMHRSIHYKGSFFETAGEMLIALCRLQLRLPLQPLQDLGPVQSSIS